MGSAALYHLSARGVSAVGIEAYTPSHELGSSHGDSRLIRLGYFEDPSYVPLLERAYANWHDLGARLGEQVLSMPGVLQIGRPDSKIVSGTLASCQLHGLDHEVRDAEETMRRFPAFTLPENVVSIFDPKGGFVRPENAVSGYLRLATESGSEIRTHTRVARLEDSQGLVEICTEAGDIIKARKVVVATGPWIAELVPEIGVAVNPIRQVVGWYRPAKAEVAVPGIMPCFLYDQDDGSFFGFPEIGADGVKIGRHAHFREPIDPDLPNPEVNARDRALLDGFAADALPDAASVLHKTMTCRYTLLPSEDFLIDALPNRKNIIVCSACSGHGFKFASVIGEILADLALDGETGLPVDLFSYQRHFAAGAPQS